MRRLCLETVTRCLSGTRGLLICQKSLFHASTRLLHRSFQLRPYQEECIRSCLAELATGSRKIAVSLPTGGGKTVIFSNLIQKVQPRAGHGDKTLILVHRKELAVQAAETCKRFYPDKQVQIEMANFHAESDADIVVASVQTLVRGRLNKFDPKDFKLVIIDECHHAAASSYQTILQTFGILHSRSPDVALVGFSATLRREDDKQLESVFDKIAFHLELEQLIESEHLSDAKFTTVRLLDADLSKVQTRMGDFVIKGLSAAMNKPSVNEVILRTYLYFRKTHKIKSTMLFGINIEHVEGLCKLFKSRGVIAEFVTSKTKRDARDRVIKEFKEDRISVLMNCGIFTEGTDMPNIDCILLARPTKSKTLLIQMIGRGLRLHESKEYCHVVDFVGINNSSVVTTPTLRNLPPGFESNGMTFEEMDAMKKRIEEKKRLQEQRDAEREVEDQERRIQEIKEAQELLNRDVRNGFEKNLETSELQLTTFNSFNEFVTSVQLRESDLKYIFCSEYPWLKGPTKNVWILPRQSDLKHSHLRLEIHPKGLTKEFLEEVEINDVYSSSKNLKITEKVYTLAMYGERPAYTSRRHHYVKRWDARLVLPVTMDIRSILDNIRPFMGNTFVDASKFAKWRQSVPTSKQINALKKIVERMNVDIDTRVVDQFNKGEVSDLMGLFGVFKGKTFKQFLEKVIDKKQKETIIAEREGEDEFYEQEEAQEEA